MPNVDNTTLPLATTAGDSIRTVAKTATGAKVQAFLMDVGGGTDSSPEVILSAGQKTGALSIPVVLASDLVVPVSGTVTASIAGTVPVSIASMPSTPVTGAFYQATQPVSGSVAVTGAYQATQPVSAASLPLPAGAATAAGITAVVTALGSPMQAGGTVTANLGTLNGAATASGVAAVVTALGSPLQAGGSVSLTGAVSLPTGASTSALQSTANGYLTSLAGVVGAIASTAPTSGDLIVGVDGSGNSRAIGVAIVHNGDNQAFGAGQYGIIAGGVTQIVNSTGNLDRAREGYADAMPITGFVGGIGMLWNGASYDRNRAVAGDAMAITGVQGAVDLLWNGSSFDRPRSVSGDAMAGTGLEAASDMLWNGASYDRPRTAAAAQAGTGTGVAAEAAFGVYNITAPTLTNGMFSAMQMDSAGNLLVKNNAALPAGPNIIGTIFGTYNSTAPVLTTGQTAPLQTDSSGNLKITGAMSSLLTAVPVFGQQLTTTSGVALPSTTLINGVTFLAPTSNAGPVYLGATSAVTAATGFPVYPGQPSPFFPLSNINGVYIVGINGTDKIVYTGN